MESNKQNKKSKRKMALNCAIGTLALLGSVGTITFGTLWCQARNGGGGDTPVDDKIIKGEYSWQSGETAEPFEYPEDYQALPEDTMKLGELWGAFTSNDKCGYYLACDYIAAWSNLLFEPSATYDASVELNVTKQRLSLVLHVANEEDDFGVEFINVPVAITLIPDEETPPGRWSFEPIGASSISFHIFTIPDWKINVMIEGEEEISPDSGLEGLGLWGTTSTYFCSQIHYFDKITLE